MEAAGKDGLASLHIPAAFCCIAQIFDLHLEHFQAEIERERERSRWARRVKSQLQELP